MHVQHSSLDIYVTYTAGALILSRKCQASVLVNLYQFTRDAHILRNPFTTNTIQQFECDGLLYVASKTYRCFAISTVKELKARKPSLYRFGTVGDYVDELMRQVNISKRYRLM